MYFRSLSVFAAIACAAFSSAAPLAAENLTGLVGGVASYAPVAVPALPNLSALPVSADALTGVVSKVGGTVSNPTGSLTSRADGHPSLPEVLQDVCKKLLPVTDKLRAAVAVDAKIDIDVVVALVKEIIALLSFVVDKVQYIVDHPTEFILSIGDSVLSLKEVSFLLSTLLWLVLDVLKVVVGAVGDVNIDVVLPLIATVGATVAHILSLTLLLVPSILGHLIPTLASLLQTVYYLRLADVIAVLGLPPLV